MGRQLTHWGSGLPPAPLSESDAQRTHFEGAERRTKCSESFSLWDAALLHNQRRKPHPLSCPLRREISPLRFASVEMTRGALANIVISSGDACRYGADGKALMKLRVERSPTPMLPVPWWSEISPLRFATVEMTIGVPANIVISSGGMRRYGC